MNAQGKVGPRGHNPVHQSQLALPALCMEITVCWLDALRAHTAKCPCASAQLPCPCPFWMQSVLTSWQQRTLWESLRPSPLCGLCQLHGSRLPGVVASLRRFPRLACRRLGRKRRLCPCKCAALLPAVPSHGQAVL